MGHSVDFRSFPESATKEEMYEHSVWFAKCNVDRGENPFGNYSNVWKKNSQIFDSREEAEEFLDSRGLYVDGCVRYKKIAKKSKKMIDIENKINVIKEKKSQYIKDHDVRNRKSKFIGCEKCGSKIAKDYLKTNSCPICGNDLRAEYIIEKEKSFNEKIKNLKNEYKNEEKKQANKKPIIKWLVKTEVHC